MRYPLSSPSIGDRERRYVDDALQRGWISGTGDYVTQFEQALGRRTRRAHVVAVANGTLALELALRALGIGPGAEVIVPALSFAAPAMSVLAVGADVVLADVDPLTWTLDPIDAARRLTRQTAAVIAVDVLGHPADYSALGTLGVPVVQDCAEAHGAAYRGDPVGGQADVSVFSFHANKAVTTGEGGSAATNRPDFAEHMRLLANHGMTARNPYVHDVVGRNYRMANLTAAIGLAQVERWEQLVGARAAVAAHYRARFAETPLSEPQTAPWATRGTWLHTIIAPARDALVSALRAGDIDARAIWPPLHHQPVLSAAGARAGRLPVAEHASATALWLPTSATMTVADVDAVANAVVAATSSRRRPMREEGTPCAGCR